jgi:protease-4
MAQFFKNVFSSFLGTFIAISILLAIVIGVVASALSRGAQNELLVNESNFLKITLETQLVEYAENNPLSDLAIAKNYFPKKTGVHQIRQALETAVKDENIKGVYLKLGLFPGGFGQAEEIREQLVKFKESGKSVVVYGDGFDEKSYYIATAADCIGLNPLGLLEFNGLRAEVLYFTGLFEKLGIEVNIFKVGTYKSAVEPFFLKKMSEANKEQLTAFLGGIQSSLEDSTAKARSLDPAQVHLVADSMLIRNATDAKNQQFVDIIDYENEFLTAFKDKQNIKEIKLVNYTTYNKVNAIELDESADKIAVLFSEGEIIYGESADGKKIGHHSIIKQLKKLTKDSTVKAIVLRINSPGGSGHASDLMWKQLQETRKYKPVIASMSDYAASGGYYMAMACDQIVAHPMTITGSIGVFGMFPTFGGFMKDKLGVTSDGVKTGVYSDLFSVNRPMREEEKAIVQEQINQFYTMFVQKAADSRRVSYNEINAIASGRVWNGQQAFENGLVDYLGGLDKAISLAKTQAELSDYQLISYNKLVEEDPESILGSSTPETIHINTSDLYQDQTVQQYINLLDKLNTCQGVQARLPFEMQIR